MHVTFNDNSTEELHVVLNELNVMDSFFDKKVSKDIFGNDLLSPIFRLCESRLQNNDCPVESIISMFTPQTFRIQHKDTAENRVIIKINGDSISGSEAFCDILAEMSFEGVESWGIDKLTLLITYGRYNNPLTTAFVRDMSKRRQKFSYMYNCGSEIFNTSMKAIA